MVCPGCGRSFHSRHALGVHLVRTDCRTFVAEFKRESQRLRDRKRRRQRTVHTPESRAYARRAARRDWHRRNQRASRAIPELEPLYPELRRGWVVSFWEDELRMDLEQERALAELEGRDPREAVKCYRSREYAEKKMAGFPLFLEILAENVEEMP